MNNKTYKWLSRNQKEEALYRSSLFEAAVAHLRWICLTNVEQVIVKNGIYCVFFVDVDQLINLLKKHRKFRLSSNLLYMHDTIE